MIRPAELESENGRDVWDMLVAASAGDVAILRRLLERNPRLSRAEYWYTPAVHFAVREGHANAVQFLLDAGADPEWNGLNDRSLIEMARERGHRQIAQMVERARDRRGRVIAEPADHPIHTAAARGDANAVRALLDDDASLVNLGDQLGGAPLHRAVLGGAPGVVSLLLDRGANVHAFHGSSRGLSGGLIHDLQAIDLAVWGGRRQRGDLDIARQLVSRGATYDLVIASALGDLDTVTRMLEENPSRIREARPSGRRPLPAAVEFGHDEIARLLLSRGADPRWEEPYAPTGTSLHSASARGNLALVKLLLEHGADPNEDIDSTASALEFAATPEIRALIEAHRGTTDPYNATWVDDDDALRRAAGDPNAKHRVGAAFTMVAGSGERDRLARLLQAGLRVPPVLTGCQTYLLAHTDMLRTLLAHEMNPDLMNWQHQTLLHFACTGDDVERATILLDAGATITARDDEYRSAPLAWAARASAPKMVEFLLSRGAPTNLPDDEPWATPLAWAVRRGHSRIVEILRSAGASG
jgi:ankyrin repeat protein